MDYSERDFARAAAFVLRRLRKKARLSQEKLADAVGLTRQYMTRLEGGHHVPSPYLLAALAHHYGLLPGELLESIVLRATQLGKRHRRPPEG